MTLVGNDIKQLQNFRTTDDRPGVCRVDLLSTLPELALLLSAETLTTLYPLLIVAALVVAAPAPAQQVHGYSCKHDLVLRHLLEGKASQETKSVSNALQSMRK